MILRITLVVNRKRLKLRAVSAIAELLVYILHCAAVFSVSDSISGLRVLLSWILK